MKLTEGNFEVINYYHSTKDKIKVSEQLKQQILSDHEDAQELKAIKKTGLIFSDREWVKGQIKQLREKAEKWDEYLKPYKMRVPYSKLEQENRQLKEENASSADDFQELSRETKKLKEIVEKVEKRIKELEPIKEDYSLLGIRNLSPLQAETIIKELKELLATKKEGTE